MERNIIVTESFYSIIVKHAWFRCQQHWQLRQWWCVHWKGEGAVRYYWGRETNWWVVKNFAKRSLWHGSRSHLLWFRLHDIWWYQNVELWLQWYADCSQGTHWIKDWDTWSWLTWITLQIVWRTDRLYQKISSICDILEK